MLITDQFTILRKFYFHESRGFGKNACFFEYFGVRVEKKKTIKSPEKSGAREEYTIVSDVER